MRLIAGLLAAVTLMSLLTCLSFAACIRGELGNFDVHNFTNNQVNDFTLILQGIRCNDIVEYYFPAMYDSIRCWEDAQGTHIKWYFPPVDPCAGFISALG